MASDEATKAKGAAPADWVEQTRALSGALIDAQSKMWGDWVAATRSATEVPSKLTSDWLQQWQNLAQASLSGWPPAAPDTSRVLAERVLAGEQVFLSFVEMTLGMMKAVAPAIDADENWTDLLRRFLDQMREDAFQGQNAWLRPAAFAGAGADMGELWRLYAVEMQRLYGPWGAASTDMAHNLAAAGRGDPAALRKSFAGFVDAYEVTFGRFLSAPAVGSTRESSERLLKSFDAWVEMNRAAADFQAEIANEGLHAVEALTARLVEMGERDEKVTSLRQFFDLWSDTVDSVYYKLFGSDNFASLQGRFVNASMEYRKRQADLLDEAMDAVGLPGRREVDTIHRRVHDMRREMRALKREMTELRAELVARPASAKAPARKKPAPRAGKTS